MTTDIAVNTNNLPAELRDLFNVQAQAGDLSDGVTGGFSVISIRGSKWRIKHGGEEDPVLDANGEPQASLELVIVKANPHVSKIYYATAYSAGDAEQPDCFSLDGIKPDATAESKQSPGCASCPHNQWGSRITPQGKKAKACSDNRRLAVVPLNDLQNAVYGGAMLLRVPAASLGDLATYGKKMAAKGYPYNAVSTRFGFDVNASYPKLTFKAVRPLTDDELRVVATHITSERTTAVLSTLEDAALVEDAPAAAKAPSKVETVDTEFEIPPADTDAPAKPAKPVSKRKAPASKSKDEDEEKDTSTDTLENDNEGSADSELDNILAELDNLS